MKLKKKPIFHKAELPAGEYPSRIVEVSTKDGETNPTTFFLRLEVIDGPLTGRKLAQAFKAEKPFFIEKLLKDYGLSSTFPSPLDGLKRLVGLYGFATITDSSSPWVAYIEPATPEEEVAS